RLDHCSPRSSSTTRHIPSLRRSRAALSSSPDAGLRYSMVTPAIGRRRFAYSSMPSRAKPSLGLPIAKTCQCISAEDQLEGDDLEGLDGEGEFSAVAGDWSAGPFE